MIGVVKLKPLLFHMIVPFAVGMVANWLTPDTARIYQSLLLPSFAPKAEVFGIVWPILYFLMGLAAYRISQAQSVPKKQKNTAMLFYWLQLFFNFWWTLLYFRFGFEQLAFWDLILITVLASITMVLFYRIDKIAGILLVPYVAWLLFAGVLFYTVNQLNP